MPLPLPKSSHVQELDHPKWVPDASRSPFPHSKSHDVPWITTMFHGETPILNVRSQKILAEISWWITIPFFMLQRCPKIRQSSGPWAPDTGRLPVRVAWMAHLTPGTTKDAEKTMVSWVWNIINVHNSNFTRKKWLVIQPQKLGYSVLKD